ncbi:hypothetical protein MHW47_19710 [Streptomyces sp. OfavH-34-F]|uniref:hypothetical protein n=1 Tax=Streptomyces sp. OfavH-34-F TaxID=2917760 RepID=UPI001EF2B514|nr:hypothetical protein [Streptomyces sp. OfavH-34-F]MCG7526668.1 hypothetical protein [Streptomyces sp. OfavH-34-F]
MRGLTGSGDDGTVTGRTGGGTTGGGPARRLTRWAASSAALTGLAVFGLCAVSCSTGGTGTRDEGPAGTDPVARVTPSTTATVTARPAPRVDAVALLKADPKVSGRVRMDLKPCTGDEYPVDTSYGKLTGGPSPDVVVNVMTCGDSIGVGTYVYRPGADGAYHNVFAVEQPAVYGTIDRGDLVVTIQMYEQKDQVAYPSGEEVITYHWSGGRFGEEDRVLNDFNRAVGTGDEALPEPTEPPRN